MSKLKDKWNKNKFSIYSSEEKTTLKLIENINNFVGDELVKEVDNKTELYGNHLGQWQGLNKPTLSEEGMRATVEKHIDDISSLDNKTNDIETQVVELEKVKTNFVNTTNENILVNTTLAKDLFINEDITLNGTIPLTSNSLSSNNKTITINNADEGIKVDKINGILELKNITFKGNVKKLLAFKNLKMLKIVNCNFIDIGRNVLWGENIENVIIDKCIFKNINGGSVMLYNCKNVLFTKCIGENIGTVDGFREGALIYADGSTNVIISDNITSDNLDSALYTNHCNGGRVVITNNIINMCYKEAIKNQNCGSKTIISSNIINNCLGNGIIAHYCGSDVNITNNQLFDTCLYAHNGITLNGTILGAISINNVYNYNISNNLIKRTRNKDAYGIKVQNYSAYKQKNNRGIIANNIITDTSNSSLYIQDTQNTNILGNVLNNSCLSNLVTGFSRTMLFLLNIKGNVNNNIFNNNVVSEGDCIIDTNNQIQMPLGMIENADLYLNANITFYVTDSTNKEIYLDTVISSVDTSLRKISIEGNLSSLMTISNKVKYVITLNTPLLNSYVRFYDNVKINFIGNMTEKREGEENYKNDTPLNNVIPQLEQYTLFNNYTIN